MQGHWKHVLHRHLPGTNSYYCLVLTPRPVYQKAPYTGRYRIILTSDESMQRVGEVSTNCTNTNNSKPIYTAQKSHTTAAQYAITS
jgi:hypothetical protein